MRNFILKGIVFGVILLLLLSIKFIYEYKNFEVLNHLNSALDKKTEVIMFGSSVNKHATETEEDKRSISEMVNDICINKNVSDISHPAYHSEMYYALFEYIQNTANYKPIVIIPINLRYFSPEWDLRPAYQFTMERNLLDKNIFWNFYSSYEENSINTFTYTPVFVKDEKLGIVNDFIKKTDSLTELKNGFILNYMQPISPDHRKLKALCDIYKLAVKKDMNVLFYITPIDYQKANSLNIKYFDEEVNKNITTIKYSLSESNLLDMSYSLTHDKFDYQEKPNEHLNSVGRIEVANMISKKLFELN